jgi:parvulin-like peptidyl-prolyl isomerase
MSEFGTNLTIRIIMRRLTLFSLFLLMVASWGFTQADLQTVAIVKLTKSEPITVRQLRTEVERMERSTGRPLTNDERRQVLDAMINEKLAIQAADRDKITVSENDVNAQINQLKGQLAMLLGRPPTDAEFALEVRKQTGLELPAFREQLKRQLIVQKYLMSKKQSTIESFKVPTEAEIVSTYNLTKSQLVRPDTVRFSMIMVSYGADAAAKTRAKELADRLFREIGSNPSKFDEVVLRGQSPNSGYQAGDAGYLPRNMAASQVLGQEFINVAFNLKQGEISKLMEGEEGYQIIKITETYAQKSLELDDIYQLGTRMTVRDYISNVMLQERQMETLAKATEELVTELRAGGRNFEIHERNLTW